MRIHGTAFEITDLNGFVQHVIGSLSKSKSATSMTIGSLLGNGGIVDTVVDMAADTLSQLDDLLPDELDELIESLTDLGIVRPLTDARVHVGFLMPGRIAGALQSSSFFPPLSVKTRTNALGAYTLTISDEQPAQLPASRGFLLVFQPSGSVTIAGQTIQLFSLIYRSTTFDLQPGDQTAAPIFVLRQPESAGQAITQADINSRVSAIRKRQKFDAMSAQIGDQRVAVRVADQGGEVTFDVELRGSSSPNLNEFVDFKVRNFVSDLPGPDFITTICIDEKDIERTVKAEVSSLERSANSEILSGIVKSVSEATLLPPTIIEEFFKNNVTVSIPAINTPRQTWREGSITRFLRSIVLDVSIGIPRRLFKTEAKKK